jgi:hypothetical protein
VKQSRSESGQFKGYSDKELYELFKSEYARSEAKLESRGDEMYAPAFKNFREFEANIIAARNDGEKVGAKFVRDLVADMEYAVTRRSAQAQAKVFRQQLQEDPAFAEATGRKGISSWEFRQGAKGNKSVEAFYDLISGEYYYLRSIGLTGKQAQAQISRSMFGSP